jgi:hypothetical protein
MPRAHIHTRTAAFQWTVAVTPEFRDAETERIPVVSRRAATASIIERPRTIHRELRQFRPKWRDIAAIA